MLKYKKKKSTNKIINEATIDFGESVRKITQLATKRGLNTLPDNQNTGNYHALSWTEFRELEDGEYSPSIGSNDMRIIDSTRQDIKHVSVFANQGDLTGTESWWEEACNIDYPIMVLDRKGFSYKNEAYLSAEKTGKT